MVNPSWPSNSGNTNDTNIQNSVQQWLDDQAQVGIDKQAIDAAIAQMEADITHGNNVFGAMMIFFSSIFPDVLTYQEDTMNTLADSQNISSDLRSFVTQIQKDFNTGATLDPNGSGSASANANAIDLYNNTQDLKSWTDFLDRAQSGLWTSKTCPLDASDGETISNSLKDIEGAFGGGSASGVQVQTGWNWGPGPNNGPDQWNPTYTTVNWTSKDGGAGMATAMWNWNNSTALPTTGTPPSGTPGPTPPQPATEIKEIQGDLQQSNSSVSTMATTTQTTEQFYTNQYNQLTGIDNSMQQNTISEESSFVTNQKTS